MIRLVHHQNRNFNFSHPLSTEVYRAIALLLVNGNGSKDVNGLTEPRSDRLNDRGLSAYSDIPATVTVFGRPNTVTVSGEACITKPPGFGTFYNSAWFGQKPRFNC